MSENRSFRDMATATNRESQKVMTCIVEDAKMVEIMREEYSLRGHDFRRIGNLVMNKVGNKKDQEAWGRIKCYVLGLEKLQKE